MQSMDPRSCISLRVLFEAKRVFFTPRTELIVTERRKTGRKMMKNKESEVDRVTIRGSSLQENMVKKKKISSLYSEMCFSSCSYRRILVRHCVE